MVTSGNGDSLHRQTTSEQKDAHSRKSSRVGPSPDDGSTGRDDRKFPAHHSGTNEGSRTDLPKSLYLLENNSATGRTPGRTSPADPSKIPSVTGSHARSQSLGRGHNSPTGHAAARRNCKRYSFIMERDASGNPLPERWLVFADDEERSRIARVGDHSTKKKLLTYQDLQPVVGALFDDNEALRDELDQLKRRTSEREKLGMRKKILSVTFNDQIDTDEPRQKISARPALKDVAEKGHNADDSRLEDVANTGLEPTGDAPHPLGRKPLSRTKGQQLMTELEDNKARIAELECQVAELKVKLQNNDATNQAAIQKVREADEVMMEELRQRNIDLTRRHSAAQLKLIEARDERRDLVAERDKYKKEAFALQQKRSDEQYQKLQDQNTQLRDHTAKLLQERRQLMDMNKDMTNLLPALVNLQTKNQREQHQRFENERAQAYEHVLNDDAKDESGSPIYSDVEPPARSPTMEDLMKRRTGPVQYATPPPKDPNVSDSSSSGETIAGNVFPDGIDYGAIGPLRVRNPSGVPAAPGVGLEESRSLGSKPLKERPGSIIRPTGRVRGLPEQAVRGSVSAQNQRTASKTAPSGSGRRQSRMSPNSAANDGGPITGQIDLTRVIDQLPRGSRESIAWQEVAEEPQFVHQNSPLSGLTPFFDLFSDPKPDFKHNALINFDIRGCDNKYNLRMFKQGEYVLAVEDGMHDIWPVKALEGGEETVFFLPRNAIALVCDHGRPYMHATYAVDRHWPTETDKQMYGDDYIATCMFVAPKELVYSAHVDAYGEEGSQRKWHCAKLVYQDNRNPPEARFLRYQKGWIPDDVLTEQKQYNGRPFTRMVCPCADPQAYICRAWVLLDCTGASGFEFREFQEVEVAHLVHDTAQFCVLDPKTKTTDFIDAACVRLQRRPIHLSTEIWQDVVLQLTPRKYEFASEELLAMELSEEEIRLLENRQVPRIPPRNWNREAEALWEQNKDGTNPLHKNFREEYEKAAPDRVWKDWRVGPPMEGVHYIRRPDHRRWGTVNNREWERKFDTLTFNPFGGGIGKDKARSRSLMALRNPKYLEKAERSMERLMKRPANIGHQPHRRIADGIVPHRKAMSEPIIGEPFGLERHLNYVKKNGALVAEELTDYNVHDLPLWEFSKKDGQDWIGYRMPHFFRQDMMPVEEDVQPFSFEAFAQRSQQAFAYNVADDNDDDDSDPMKVFLAQQSYGFDLVYQFKDQAEIAKGFGEHVKVSDRFRIVKIVEGSKPFLLIRPVQDDEFMNDNAPSIKEYLALPRPDDLDVQPEDLDPEPFLRTAVMKDDEKNMDALLVDREKYQFVLLRESTRPSVWDSWYMGEIVPAKPSHLTLLHPDHWTTLSSIFVQVMHAYNIKQISAEARKSAEQPTDPTTVTPEVDDWDFFYPIMKDHFRQGPGFMDLRGPDPYTDDAREYVRVHSDKYGYCACTTFNSGEKGTVHIGHIDKNEPHLPVYQLKEPFEGRQDRYFILMKSEEGSFFISLHYHQKLWVDASKLAYDERDCQLLSLRWLVNEGWLSTNDLEGVTKFLEDRPVKKADTGNAAPAAPLPGILPPQPDTPGSRWPPSQEIMLNGPESAPPQHDAAASNSRDQAQPAADVQTPPVTRSISGEVQPYYVPEHKAVGLPRPVLQSSSSENSVPESSQGGAPLFSVDQLPPPPQTSNRSPSSKSEPTPLRRGSATAKVEQPPPTPSTAAGSTGCSKARSVPSLLQEEAASPKSVSKKSPSNNSVPSSLQYEILLDSIDSPVPTPPASYEDLPNSRKPKSLQHQAVDSSRIPQRKSGPTSNRSAPGALQRGPPKSVRVGHPPTVPHNSREDDPTLSIRQTDAEMATTHWSTLPAAVISAKAPEQPPQEFVAHGNGFTAFPVQVDSPERHPLTQAYHLMFGEEETLVPGQRRTRSDSYISGIDPSKQSHVQLEVVSQTPGGEPSDARATAAVSHWSPVGSKRKLKPHDSELLGFTTPKAGAPKTAGPASTTPGSSGPRRAAGEGSTTPAGAPHVPLQTKPSGKRFVLASSMATSPKDGRGDSARDGNGDFSPTGEDDYVEVVERNGDELAIWYDDWRDREEAFKNDTSTVHRQEGSKIREGGSGERHGLGRVSDLLVDEQFKGARSSSYFPQYLDVEDAGEILHTDHHGDEDREPASIIRQAPYNTGHSKPISKTGRRSQHQSTSQTHQHLTLSPATTTITIPPAHLHRLESELELAIHWLHTHFPIFRMPSILTATPGPVSATTPTNVAPPRKFSGRYRGLFNARRSRTWTIGYLLLLAYLLFGAWLLREEWRDVNGVGGKWGVNVVRGGRGRWVWGWADSGGSIAGGELVNGKDTGWWIGG